MTDLPDIWRIHRAIDTTWPALDMKVAQGWCIRNGAGGGKRASVATSCGGTDIAFPEQEMLALGQSRLFMIRDGETALDAQLADCGYRVIDPVTAYAAPIDIFSAIPDGPCTAQALWPTRTNCMDIWAQGGVDTQRIALMQRAKTPKTVVTAHLNSTTIATSFLALDGPIAMIHAVEVLNTHRRKGAAKAIMRSAAEWARQNGADYMAFLATNENRAANALYTALGMVPVGQYHYRIK